MLELGNEVLCSDREEPCTIIGILDDPLEGGPLRKIQSEFASIELPDYEIAGGQFFDDDDEPINEPVYLVQNGAWYDWFVEAELELVSK